MEYGEAILHIQQNSGIKKDDKIVVMDDLIATGGNKWLKEWKDEQSRYNLVRNRLQKKNLVMWNPNKEA